ncbi:MAG: hypothetical protein L0H93_06555 [Nocardioides sp.]|nr:hypothetical protein [Nocardioides sp.]
MTLAPDEAPTGPRPATMASLLAGRVVYRAALYGAGLALLALWGPHEFALYATATGATSWLFALTSSGPEKAALALLPRSGAAGLERFFITVGLVPFIILTLTAALFALFTPLPIARYAIAAALITGIGTCALLVALHRLRGQHRADLSCYLLISLGYGVAVAVVATTGASYGLVLGLLLGVVLVLVAILLAHLLPLTSRRPVAPSLRRDAWRATGLLGVGELLGTAAISVLYAWFAIEDDAHQTSLFYVLVVFTSSFSVGLLYLLRLIQPQVSRYCERHGESTAWRLARRILWILLVTGIPLTATTAFVAVHVSRGPIVAIVAVALEMALFGAVAVAVLVLENSGHSGRAWSATGAAAEFCSVAALGWWLVPHTGAAGAMVAICAGSLVKAAIIVRASPEARES